MCGVSVAAKRRANAAEFVRRNGSADTTAANQYPDLSGAVLHGLTNLFCVVRIIVRNGTVVSAEVDQLMTRVRSSSITRSLSGKPP